MPNARVPAAGGALPAELPTMNELAAAILRRSAMRLDTLRRSVERDLDRHMVSRKKFEALIEQLIEKLDCIDGDDDAEGEYTSGDITCPDIDHDIVDEPHDDNSGIHGQDMEPSLGAPEGCRHDQRAWSHLANAEIDAEDDPSEHGIADEGARNLFHSDGSGDALARQQLRSIGHSGFIDPRCRRPTAMRAGAGWFAR